MHFIGGPSWRTLLIAWFLQKKNPQIKTILTFTNPFLSPLSLAVLRIIPPSLCVCLDNAWYEKLRSMKLPTVRKVVAGVDLNRFVPVDKTRLSELRIEYGIPHNKKVALHVGHLKRGRGLDALDIVASKEDWIVLIIGSSSTLSDRDLICELDEMGVDVRVGYLDNVEHIYQLADCYVFPTVDHTHAVQTPLSVFEALACGLPVISTRFGSLPDYFETSENVKFYDSKEQLCKQIEIIAMKGDEKTVIEDMSDYSWPAVAQEIEEIYHCL
jgi:glycosyltransferase involved in cell wall biosynthesis